MNSNQDALVSVVTPVYNGEPYLRECIESVLAQTYTNWDYTIVNNCSTDRTLEIAKEYAAKDSRIRVRSNQMFVRVIANYNNAVREIATESKYCKVVAADDWLYPDCLEKMVKLAESNPSVAIVGSYGLRGLAGVAWQGLPYSSMIVSGREVCRALLLGGPYIFGTPTAVLYRSDILRGRDVFYNESNFHADMEACLEFLQYQDFGFVHQILHYRRVQENSLTSYSREVNTYLSGYLQALIHYGPHYLTNEELKRRLRECLADYYRYLGSACYKFYGPEFWSYHKNKLRALGYPLSVPKLVGAVILKALDLALNPKHTIEASLRHLRQSSSGHSD